MMAFTALKIASRPININGTLFGIRGLWTIPFGSTSNLDTEFLLTSKGIPWEESLNFQVKLEPYYYFAEPQNITFKLKKSKKYAVSLSVQVLVSTST